VAADLGNLALPVRSYGIHELAHGRGFRVEDCVCCLGARSPVATREHPRTAIAVMLAGTFATRASQGTALLVPGAMLIKNAATSHEYRHVDEGGDISVIFEYDDELLDEVHASFARVRRGRPMFAALAIPGSAQTAHATALAAQAFASRDPAVFEDAALAVAAAAAAVDWSARTARGDATGSQLARVSRAVRYVDAHFADDCGLETLAAIADFSPFHFARVFRAVTGQTPRQHVIARRLDAAASALRTTHTPILEVALDAGFGDLSHFTTSFRRAFGASPGRYRARHR